MDVLFGGRKRIELDVSLTTVRDLILYLRDKELSERGDLFVDGDSLYCLLDVTHQTLWNPRFSE